MKTGDLYAAAVKKYGKISQLIMCMEEIADVEIMLEQLRVIYHNRSEVDTIKADKLRRLAYRMEEVHEK